MKRVALILMAAVSLPFVSFAATIAMPFCGISIPPGTYYPGSAVRLIWYTENASHATLNNGLGEVPLQGFRDVYPNQNTTYVMTVNSPAGTKTCAVQALITPSPSVLYQPTALPINLFPGQVYWAPMRAPYVNDYYDDGYDWYVDSPYMREDSYYMNRPPDYTIYDAYGPIDVYSNSNWPVSFSEPVPPVSPQINSPLLVAVDSFPTALQPSTYWSDAPVYNPERTFDVDTPVDPYPIQNTQRLDYTEPSLW